MKKIFPILFALVLALGVFLCSCKNDSADGANTNTNTNTDSASNNTNTDTGTNTGSAGTNTNTNTGTGTNTNTNTGSSGSDNTTEQGPTYDTVIEHGLRVEDMITGIDGIFDATVDPSNGTLDNYTNPTMVDVSVHANNGKYAITKGGVYQFYGQSQNGQIQINLSNSTSKDVVLILNNLTMTSDSNNAIIYAEKCNSVRIVIPNGTETTLTDTTTNSSKGVIYVKSCNLTIDGKGTLNVNANSAKSRGIFNTKTLTINGGVYNINTAVSHGIQGEQGLVINGGTFNIVSAKSGLKSGDYDEDKPEEAVEGKVTINGGVFNIDSTTNGISSYGTVEINGGKLVIDSDSDGIDASLAVTFNGGITDIKAGKDGIKSDATVNFFGNSNVRITSYNDGIDANSVKVDMTGLLYIKNEGAFIEDVAGSYIFKNGRYQLVDPTKYPNDTKYSLQSCKGMKINTEITIANGTVGIDTYEDAIDSATCKISGGKVVLQSNDDGMDVSESIQLTGGVLEIINSNKGIKVPSLSVGGTALATVLSSSDSVDCPNVKVTSGTLFLLEKLDIGDGTLEVTGGTVIVLSTTNKPAEATSTTLKTVSSKIDKATNCKFGNWLRITDGENTVAFRLPKNYSAKMSVSCISADVTTGEYTIQVGAYQVENKINTFVYTGGTFIPSESITVTVE